MPLREDFNMEELYKFVSRLNEVCAEYNIYFVLHPVMTKQPGFGGLKNLEYTLFWTELNNKDGKAGWLGKESFNSKGSNEDTIIYSAINTLLKFFIEHGIQYFTVK